MVLCCLGVWSSPAVGAAEAEKTVQDSMKRFSLKVPASWKATENREGNSLTLTGEDCVIVVSPVFRGNNLEELHRRMAQGFAMRSVAGPPKKNKIKWDKRSVGNLKAFDSVYDIKGGPEDPHKEYRVHVITVDGEKHKFSLVTTIPLDVASKDSLEEHVSKIVESFDEK